VTIRGIDISNYQSSTYALDGYDFVIVKATEGTSYLNPKHDAQVARARSHDRVVGHYHYLSPSSGITDQMDYFLAHADARRDEFLAVDWEETGVSSAEKDRALRYLRGKAGGRKVLLYCNVDFWLNHDTSSFAADGLWIAHYTTPGRPGVTADWLIHQFTSDPIDTNVAEFPSRAAMAAWAAAGAGGEAAERPPRRALFGTDGLTRTVEPDTWTTVAFNQKHDDGEWVGIREAQSSFLFGPCHYSASLGVRVAGLARGDEFQLRLSTYKERDGGFERIQSTPTHSPVHSGGDGRFVYTWHGFLPGADRGRARAEVRYLGNGPVSIEWARAEALYWPAG
jgi:hypothetical protein